MTPIRQRLRAAARSAVLGVAGRLAKPGAGYHILNGHNLGECPSVGAELFARQLHHLSNTVRLLNIDEAVESIQKGEVAEEPFLSFTFDDGFSDWAAHLAPVLEDFNVRAAFFLNPGFVDLPQERIPWFHERLRSDLRSDPISSADVGRLSSMGHVIGSHTLSHSLLASEPDQFLFEEIVESASRVESLSGVPCTWFAWPFGQLRHIDARSLKLALESYDVVFSAAGEDAYSVDENRRVLHRRHAEPWWPSHHVEFFTRRSRFYSHAP